MKKINIILASYNGEKYIKEQIESILNQTIDSWKLLIRDDGSKDGTIAIIEEYIKKYPDKIEIIQDNKTGLGAAKNFLELLKYVDAEYTMFCDQDDYWVKDKIERTLKKMLETEKKVGKEKPIVIHTDLFIVDEKLNLMSNSFFKNQKLKAKMKGLNRLLLQNNITGCTMMINLKMKSELLTVSSLEGIMMHDWWIALTASAFGAIEFIDTPTILYRQHSNNTLGAKKWNFIKALMSMKNNRNNIISKTIIQAEVFKKHNEIKISKKNLALLTNYINLLNYGKMKKIYTILRYRFFRMNFVRTLGFINYILNTKMEKNI